MAKFEIVSTQKDSPLIFDHPDGTSMVLVTPEIIDIIELSNKKVLLEDDRLTEEDYPIQDKLVLRRVVGVDKDNAIVFEHPYNTVFTKEKSPLNTTWVCQYIDGQAFSFGLVYHWGHEDLRGVLVGGNTNYDRLFVEIVGEWSHIS